MRPRLVEYLNALFGTAAFEWLVPEPPVVYALAMLAVLWVMVRRAVRGRPANSSRIVWAVSSAFLLRRRRASVRRERLSCNVSRIVSRMSRWLRKGMRSPAQGPNSDRRWALVGRRGIGMRFGIAGSRAPWRRRRPRLA